MGPYRHVSRRDFLSDSGFGIGGLAVSWLLAREAAAAPERQTPRDLKPRRSHFAARATAVVHFMQNGGASQMDLFDPKPETQKRDGQGTPQSIEIYQKGNSDKLLASPFAFRKRGDCGMELA